MLLHCNNYALIIHNAKHYIALIYLNSTLFGRYLSLHSALYKKLWHPMLNFYLKKNKCLCIYEIFLLLL